jgi:hypothetical protein
VRPDGEGVFEFLHPGFQVLDLPALFLEEEVLDTVQALLNLGHILRHLADIVCYGGEPCIDHPREVICRSRFCRM